MKKQKVIRILTILLPLAAALLSALPNVVKMNWMGGYTTYCSAYDMVPVGYAVWGPFGGAMGAIVLTVLAVVSVFKEDKGIENAMLVIAVIAALLSLSAVLFGNMTIPGCVITALLAADAVVLYCNRR